MQNIFESYEITPEWTGAQIAAKGRELIEQAVRKDPDHKAFGWNIRGAEVRDPALYSNVEASTSNGYFLSHVMQSAPAPRGKAVTSKKSPSMVFKRPKKPFEIAVVVPWKDFDRWTDFVEEKSACLEVRFPGYICKAEF